jgi:hypothetical protein
MEPVAPDGRWLSVEMTAQMIAETLRPVEALDALMARHGVMRVLLAMPVAALKRRRNRVVLSHELSPHLLRDVGLRDSSRSKSWELG